MPRRRDVAKIPAAITILRWDYRATVRWRGVPTPATRKGPLAIVATIDGHYVVHADSGAAVTTHRSFPRVTEARKAVDLILESPGACAALSAADGSPWDESDPALLPVMRACIEVLRGRRRPDPYREDDRG